MEGDHWQNINFVQCPSHIIGGLNVDAGVGKMKRDINQTIKQRLGGKLIPSEAEEGLSTSDFRLATGNFQPTSNFVLELFVLMFPSQGFVKL